ncbi:MAG: TIGR04282 family arsenosugar biosynthesis glycosyltransferase [Microscillaceae bacterium]
MIFVKNPVLGKVKTRLAKSIGEAKALWVYEALLQHTHQLTDSLPVDKAVFYADFVPETDLWDGYAKYLQSEGDLGHRMQAAFAQSFGRGYQKIVIIGSDCYELTSSHLEAAFSTLNQYPVVIGPAHDGGYYLLGMTKPRPFLFENKPWSTNQVLPLTRADLQQHQTPWAELPTLRDIDEAQDLPPHWQ